MPLNRLPNFINSNISLTGVSADYLDGIDLSTISSSLRANNNITGGGTITFDASGNLIWSDRFIVMANGRGPLTAPQGYFDIYMPPAGTTITGLGGSGSRTVSASGIAIGGWEALYYILPTGINQITNNNNFRIVTYFSDVDIPHDWVLLAIRNGDVSNQYLYLNNGIVLGAGQSNYAGFSGNLFVGASNTENYIAFRGTTGDSPGSFDHGFIGERIWGGGEKSELLLFKGNDNDPSSGYDRIRHFAAQHMFDTYTTATSGTFSTVGASANAITRMVINPAGSISVGSTSETLGASSVAHQFGIVSSAAANIGLVVRGATSQSGDLSQWQNSAGSVLAKVDSGGNVLANSFQSRYFVDAANSATPYLDFNSNKITVVNRNTGWVNLTVQGIASQTADLQQWQNSASTILGRVSSQGAVLGTLIGTETNYFPYFETIMPGGNDQSWKKLITLNLPVGLYTGLSFAIDISENNGNFGNNAIVYKSRYIVSVIRSGGVQDDSNTITIVGPEGNRFLRGLKINSSTYEIQFKQPSDWNQVNVKIQGLSAQTTNITYGTHYQYHSLMSGGTAATVAGTAVYSPTYGNLERFTAINSTQVIAQALDTGTVPLVARATTRTNLVPNPSFETNTTGWDGSFENTTIARTTAVASSGTASLSITSVAAGNMSIRYGYGTSSIPVTQNTQYTFSIFVRSATVSRNMRIFLSWFNGNTFISNSAESPNIASFTTAWTRINVTALAPAGVNYCAPYITILSTAAAGEVHYVDAALLESGPYLGSYIDTTASMTAYVQEWQNNAGTAVAYVRSDGYANFGGNVQGPTVAGGGWIGGANITANPTVTSGIGIISRGIASQTGDLLQIQNSAGTVLANILSDGSLGAKSVTIQGGGGQYVAGSIYSDANWGMIFRAKQASPAQAHFRWADSADSELMRIDASGNTTINAIADGTTTTATRGAGYMGMPQVQVSSGGRTLAATDAGKHIYVTTNSSQTITIPANSAVAFPVGTTIVIVNANTISTSIAITTDTLRLANSTSTGTRTLASNGMCTLLKIANTEWIASGNGLT